MRLLLVEDSVRLQRSLRMGLTQAGYAVDVTPDGLDALKRANEVAYDVIVMDIMIPSMDGLEVLRELRGSGNACHVILLTAKDTVGDRVKGLQDGAKQEPIFYIFPIKEIRAALQKNKNAWGKTFLKHVTNVQQYERNWSLIQDFLSTGKTPNE